MLISTCVIMCNACIHPYIVPVVGMLCGNAIIGISRSLDYVLKKLECVISLALSPFIAYQLYGLL
jgi:hypothetical protein